MTTAGELVIFDCDGVLVDSERLINRLESRLVASLGLELSPDQCRDAFKGHTVGEMAAMLEAKTGAAISAEWLHDWGLHTAHVLATELQAVPGVHDVLHHLAARGIPACVASQSPRPRVDLSLAATKLSSYFGDHVFTAALVPRSKPHPDVFLYAAARMGASPARCTVIEDSASGVRAAVAAGMRVLGYAADEDPAELARAGAEQTFRTMTELPALLADRRVDDARDDGPAGRVRDAYAAFAAGDGRALADLLAPDVVYNLPGRHLGGGTLRGRTAVFDRLADAARGLDLAPAIQLLAVAGHGEWALTIERFTARRRGRALDQDVCVVWRVVDSRCVELWARFADQASCDAFWQAP